MNINRKKKIFLDILFEFPFIYYGIQVFEWKLLVTTPIIVMMHLGWYIFIIDSCIAISSIGLICFVAIIHLKSINRRIFHLLDKNVVLFQRSLNIHIYKNIKQFIEEHNDFCHIFVDYNRFWSKVYFAFFFTLIPINLVLLHQILFEDIEWKIRLFLGFAAIILTLEVYIIQYIFAYISYEIHKTTKLLARLQWRLKGWPFRLRIKLKLMTYFERLSSKRKIGFTIGSTIVLTFPIFLQVSCKFTKYIT